jgi:hypothetical protein
VTHAPGEIAVRVVSILEELGIPYFVGGSVASIVHGVVRTTMDVDVVADIKPEQVTILAERWDSDFFVDVDALRDAIDSHRQTNIIHRDTMLKVDLHPMDREGFHRSELARRVRVQLADDPDATVFVASAEDTVLAKLVWYRKGGEVSERQWRDVLGILKVQGSRLDLRHLQRWASTLGVEDLLQRAFAAAGT